MRIYLDTNILLDYLFGPARPSFESSMQVIGAAAEGKLTAVLSVQSVTDAAYIYTRKSTERQQEFRKRILVLCRFVKLTSITTEHAEMALLGSFPDFEDEEQLRCAISEQCHFFLTNDSGILEAQPIPGITAISPQEILSLAARQKP